MDNPTHISYRIDDRSYVSYVKREIHNLLVKSGFSETRTGQIDIVVSELASNLIKHAGSGELLYRMNNEEKENKSFEIISLDQGEGNHDIQRMIRDGMSTTNTLGNGLGAIQRLSDFFQIFSVAGGGTTAIARSYRDPLPEKWHPDPDRTTIDAIQVCYPGEQLCGDGYCVVETREETRIFVGDGLGHGPHAHHAVQEAIRVFRESRSASAGEVLRQIHQGVKKTRGLVATVALLNHQQRRWNICGVGNISTRLYKGMLHKNYMSYNGIIGMNVPGTMNDYVGEAEQFQTIVLCSDGIRSRWDLNKYPGILKYDPLLIASMIYKDHARRNDDMTVVVGKVNI